MTHSARAGARRTRQRCLPPTRSRPNFSRQRCSHFSHTHTIQTFPAAHKNAKKSVTLDALGGSRISRRISLEESRRGSSLSLSLPCSKQLPPREVMGCTYISYAILGRRRSTRSWPSQCRARWRRARSSCRARHRSRSSARALSKWRWTGSRCRRRATTSLMSSIGSSRTRQTLRDSTTPKITPKWRADRVSLFRHLSRTKLKKFPYRKSSKRLSRELSGRRKTSREPLCGENQTFGAFVSQAAADAALRRAAAIGVCEVLPGLAALCVTLPSDVEAKLSQVLQNCVRLRLALPDSAKDSAKDASAKDASAKDALQQQQRRSTADALGAKPPTVELLLPVRFTPPRRKTLVFTLKHARRNEREGPFYISSSSSSSSKKKMSGRR